jgi:Protein of unknown function (DUF3574)
VVPGFATALRFMEGDTTGRTERKGNNGTDVPVKRAHRRVGWSFPGRAPHAHTRAVPDDARLCANVRDIMIRAFVASMTSLASATALVACSTVASPDWCANGAIARLYLGLDTPAGEVTDEQWRAFVADVMTPQFPEGFTVIDGQGQWRNGRGDLVRESTRIVEFVHDGTPRQRERVRTVANDYKRYFNQQAVLVTQAPSSLCF